MHPQLRAEQHTEDEAKEIDQMLLRSQKQYDAYTIESFVDGSLLHDPHGVSSAVIRGSGGGLFFRPSALNQVLDMLF